MLPPTSLEVQDAIAETLQRQRLLMSTRERLAEVFLSAAFIVAVALLWRFDPPGHFSIAPAIFCFVVLVLAGRIRIDGPLVLGLGPTQLLLFAVTVVISVLTVVPGRATRLQGELHLVLLAAYVFLAIVP